MDGERANDRMVKDVYRDKVITKLAAETINLVASNNDRVGVPGEDLFPICCPHKRLVRRSKKR